MVSFIKQGNILAEGCEYSYGNTLLHYCIKAMTIWDRK